MLAPVVRNQGHGQHAIPCIAVRLLRTAPARHRDRHILSGYHISGDFFHRGYPLGNVLIIWIAARLTHDVATGNFVPWFVSLDRRGKGECFAARDTGKQPATSAPRAIHLWRKCDLCFFAVAVRYELVVRLQKVDVAGNRIAPILCGWLAIVLPSHFNI